VTCGIFSYACTLLSLCCGVSDRQLHVIAEQHDYSREDAKYDFVMYFKDNYDEYMKDLRIVSKPKSLLTSL
jgi:hypothetical protein